VVLLRNRDQVEGTLSDLDSQTVRLRGADRKQIRLERGKVAAIILSNDLSRSLRPRTPYARLVSNNGSRISLASAKSEGALLVGKTLFGSSVALPLDQVIALDLYQGRATYLSDLKPKRYEFVPYLGVSWPYLPDRSVAGNSLRLVTGVFDKGLGLHSESRITYDLGGAYEWFEATVGLDEATGRQGSAGIQVLIDGKPQDVGGPEDLTFSAPLRYLRIKVAGARALTLAVTFGRHGDVQDHVDWVDARLIK
jgi:NPCBM/NEW2 domain